MLTYEYIWNVQRASIKCIFHEMKAASVIECWIKPVLVDYEVIPIFSCDSSILLYSSCIEQGKLRLLFTALILFHSRLSYEVSGISYLFVSYLFPVYSFHYMLQRSWHVQPSQPSCHWKTSTSRGVLVSSRWIVMIFRPSSTQLHVFEIIFPIYDALIVVIEDDLLWL